MKTRGLKTKRRIRDSSPPPAAFNEPAFQEDVVSPAKNEHTKKAKSRKSLPRESGTESVDEFESFDSLGVSVSSPAAPSQLDNLSVSTQALPGSLTPSSYQRGSFHRVNTPSVGGVFGFFVDSSVVALYQYDGSGCSRLVGSGEEYIELPRSQFFLVLTVEGHNRVGSLNSPIPIGYPPVNLSNLSGKQVDDFQPELGGFDDFSGPSPHRAREQQREDFGLRALCLHKELRWSALGGPSGVVDSSATFRKALNLVSRSLRTLPVFADKAFPAFLRLNFSTPAFRERFVLPDKKASSVHLGFFLKPFEKFLSNEYLKISLERLFKCVGDIAGDPAAWSDIATPLLRLFCSSEENNIIDWDVSYNFVLVHECLSKLSCRVVSDELTTLARNEFVADLTAELTIDFPVELTKYLRDRTSHFKGSGPRQSSRPSYVSPAETPAPRIPSAGSSTPNSSERGACIKHAAQRLGVSSTSCNGSCNRPHLALVPPLSNDDKSKLKAAIAHVKEGPFKGKFMLAIA